jgi:hypothetical protein
MLDRVIGKSGQDLRFPRRPAEVQEVARRDQRQRRNNSGADQYRIVQIGHVGLAKMALE